MTHHAARTLQEQGYRLTPQRTMVWDVLRARESHLTAEQICTQVQRTFPNVNLSTVYRTLELLVGLGLVRETHLGPGTRFFEVEEEVPHHHLVCDACGAVLHVHDEDLGGLGESLGQGQGFSMREATVFGVCADCREGRDVGEARDSAVEPARHPHAPHRHEGSHSHDEPHSHDHHDEAN